MQYLFLFFFFSASFSFVPIFLPYVLQHLSSFHFFPFFTSLFLAFLFPLPIFFPILFVSFPLSSSFPLLIFFIHFIFPPFSFPSNSSFIVHLSFSPLPATNVGCVGGGDVVVVCEGGTGFSTSRRGSGGPQPGSVALS